MLTTVTESASRLAPSHFVVIAACAETKSGPNVLETESEGPEHQEAGF